MVNFESMNPLIIPWLFWFETFLPIHTYHHYIIPLRGRASHPVIFKINKSKHTIDAIFMTFQHDSWHWSQHLIDSPPSLATLARVLNQDSSLQRGAVDGGAMARCGDSTMEANHPRGASSPLPALEQAISYRINEHGIFTYWPIALTFSLMVNKYR